MVTWPARSMPLGLVVPVTRSASGGPAAAPTAAPLATGSANGCGTWGDRRYACARVEPHIRVAFLISRGWVALGRFGRLGWLRFRSPVQCGHVRSETA